MHRKTRVTDANIYDRMSCTVVLNSDIVWLVLQHAAYTGNLWDHRTLRECCRVCREWYPLAKTILFRYVVLRNWQQFQALRQARDKLLQIGSNTPSTRLGYNVPALLATWEAHTRILECHISDDFRFNDICHALTHFPSLYELRLRVFHFEDRTIYNSLEIPSTIRALPYRNDSPLAIPSTIRALRLTKEEGSHAFGLRSIRYASHIISVLSKYTRLDCLQFEGIELIPDLQSPRLFQSIQTNKLLYLELEVTPLPDALSGDLFDNLLYLILHTKFQTPLLQHTVGVFKRVKSLTMFCHPILSSPELLLPPRRLSETFPTLTELRLGMRLYDLHLPTISPHLFQISSGLMSFSLFVSYVITKPAETQPANSFTVPPSLRYFEYWLRCDNRRRTALSPDTSVIRPFLNACESMGVQLLPSRAREPIKYVSITNNKILFAYLPADYGNDAVRTFCEQTVCPELFVDDCS